MPTKKKSARSLTTSNAPTKRVRRSREAGDIIAGLKEAVAFARGEISLPVRMVNVREPVDVRALRSKLGLSQAEFASQYGISLRTLQEWEHGRKSPELGADGQCPGACGRAGTPVEARAIAGGVRIAVRHQSENASGVGTGKNQPRQHSAGIPDRDRTKPDR